MEDKKKCTILWCDEPHYAHGFCITHYRANIRYGSPYGIQNGIHFEHYTKIEGILKQARIVSKAMLDSLGILGPECPYCHQVDTHKPHCPVYDAQLILEHTK